MSKDETTQPAQRIAIDVDRSPAPPWTGHKFTCWKCGAEYQLESADECKPTILTGVLASFHAPPCWTCGETNVVAVPYAAETQEGNPS